MRKWIYSVIIVICLCIFGYSAYQLYQIYEEDHMVKEETEELKELLNQGTELEIDWAALKEKNADIIGWIFVPDCDISFPVVQGQDNSFYLNHTVEKEYNSWGAVFLDYQSNPFFEDDNSVIYGHSVEGGGMCTDLKKYADEDFFNKHLTIYLLTPQGNYEGDVFAYAKTEEDSVFYTCNFEKDGRSQVLNKMKSEALYTHDVDGSLNFITLSTCDLDYGFFSYHRMVLVAGLKETNEPIMVD